MRRRSASAGAAQVRAVHLALTPCPRTRRRHGPLAGRRTWRGGLRAAAVVEVDGSPARVAELVDALAAALDGGPPVLPLPVGRPARGHARARGHGRRHRHVGIDRGAQARGAVGRRAAGVGAGDRGAAGRPGAVVAGAARRARRGGAGDRAGAAGRGRARGAGPACGVSARRVRRGDGRARRPDGATPAWCRPSCGGSWTRRSRQRWTRCAATRPCSSAVRRSTRRPGSGRSRRACGSSRPTA